ncbi:MAG TPA: dihydrofolate reductase [Chthoniobacteraceae bacterium]|nr:dihydrofolate reductase [Chthoniobacteraceae bacterium]
MRAIAAMSLNRVIGNKGQVPWHIPEDFKWFKRATSGATVVMGRKTWESLGRPLPNRRNIVVTRSTGETRSSIAAGGGEVISGLGAFDPASYPGDVWVIGGAEIYRQLLPQCDEILLSIIPREVDGDTFFPEFESRFDFAGVVLTHPDFEVRRYVRAKRA